MTTVENCGTGDEGKSSGQCGCGTSALPLAAAFLLLGGLSSHGYSVASLTEVGAPSAALLLGGFLAAAIFGPVLLPWLPGRPFALKGALLGVLPTANCQLLTANSYRVAQ